MYPSISLGIFAFCIGPSFSPSPIQTFENHSSLFERSLGTLDRETQDWELDIDTWRLGIGKLETGETGEIGEIGNSRLSGWILDTGQN